MIKRNLYSKEFKEKIVIELKSGQSSVAQISQREGINQQTLRNWKKSFEESGFNESNDTELALRKRIAELEGALAESTLENHILKKAQKYLHEYQRKEKSSKNI